MNIQDTMRRVMKEDLFRRAILPLGTRGNTIAKSISAGEDKSMLKIDFEKNEVIVSIDNVVIATVLAKKFDCYTYLLNEKYLVIYINGKDVSAVLDIRTGYTFVVKGVFVIDMFNQEYSVSAGRGKISYGAAITIAALDDGAYFKKDESKEYEGFSDGDNKDDTLFEDAEEESEEGAEKGIIYSQKEESSEAEKDSDLVDNEISSEDCLESEKVNLSDKDVQEEIDIQLTGKLFDYACKYEVFNLRKPKTRYEASEDIYVTPMGDSTVTLVGTDNSSTVAVLSTDGSTAIIGGRPKYVEVYADNDETLVYSRTYATSTSIQNVYMVKGVFVPEYNLILNVRRGDIAIWNAEGLDLISTFSFTEENFYTVVKNLAILHFSRVGALSEEARSEVVSLMKSDTKLLAKLVDSVGIEKVLSVILS